MKNNTLKVEYIYTATRIQLIVLVLEVQKICQNLSPSDILLKIGAQP
jgi:hypothetical protein